MEPACAISIARILPSVVSTFKPKVSQSYVPELDGGGGPWFRLSAAFAAGSNLAGIVATFSKEICRDLAEVIGLIDAPLTRLLDDLGLPQLAPQGLFCNFASAELNVQLAPADVSTLCLLVMGA